MVGAVSLSVGEVGGLCWPTLASTGTLIVDAAVWRLTSVSVVGQLRRSRKVLASALSNASCSRLLAGCDGQLNGAGRLLTFVGNGRWVVSPALDNEIWVAHNNRLRTSGEAGGSKVPSWFSQLPNVAGGWLLLALATGFVGCCGYCCALWLVSQFVSS